MAKNGAMIKSLLFNGWIYATIIAILSQKNNNLREPLQEIVSNNTSLEITMNTNNLVDL